MAKRTNRVAWGLAVVMLASFGGSACARRSSDAQQKALSDAIVAGNVGAVQALLRQGADVNAHNPYGDTALTLAITRKRTEIVRLLLNRGARLERVAGLSPLSLAAMGGNAAIVRLLVTHGARVNAVDPQDGTTPLIDAVQHSSSLAPDREKDAIVDALLAGGADPNARERSRGQTALMWAARNRRPVMVRSLIAHGAAVNARDKGGMTVLMHAASGGDPAVVEFLLGHRADVNARTPKTSRTALDFARMYHPDLMPILRQAGAKQ